MLVQHERPASPLHLISQAASTSPASQLPKPNTVKAGLTPNGSDGRPRTMSTAHSSGAPTSAASATAMLRPAVPAQVS